VPGVSGRWRISSPMPTPTYDPLYYVIIYIIRVNVRLKLLVRLGSVYSWPPYTLVTSLLYPPIIIINEDVLYSTLIDKITLYALAMTRVCTVYTLSCNMQITVQVTLFVRHLVHSKSSIISTRCYHRYIWLSDLTHSMSVSTGYRRSTYWTWSAVHYLAAK
jgi:hypothetical protein